MPLTRTNVEKIAHLARLGITDKDTEIFTQELSLILNLAEQLLAVNTQNVAPMAHPLAMTQRLREDIVIESNLRDKFQTIAPATEDGLYLVPKVID
jgi:aspartyl-tRNA(Asn)/glutamyl-tRNA(Gln) amidotransferase subunit C